MHAMPSQQMEQLQAATIHKVRAELRAHALLLKCVNLCPGKCACVPSEKQKKSASFLTVSCICRGLVLLLPLLLLSLLFCPVATQ
jgi:hypothetical protein